MAMTQAEAAKLSNDMLLRGVIQTIVKETPVLSFLPFMDVTGTAVTYNREATMPAATFYDPGDTWTEATPTFTQVTTTLKILGGDADVDNFLQATYADTNDVEAEVIASRAKAVAHSFADYFITGDVVGTPKGFDGIRKLIPAGQIVDMAVNGAAITLLKLDEMIDKIRPGKPDILLMSRRTRRQLKQVRRTSGPVFEMSVDQFGITFDAYDGIPVVVDDFVPDNEVQGSSGAVCSSVYALKFGLSTGIMGLQHGGVQVETVGELEAKDATRHRIKWYCGLACMSELGVARLRGLTG